MTGADDRAVRELDRALDREGLTLAAFMPDGGRILFAARGDGYYLGGAYREGQGRPVAGNQYPPELGCRSGRAIYESLSDALAWMDDRKGGLVA